MVHFHFLVPPSPLPPSPPRALNAVSDRGGEVGVDGEGEGEGEGVLAEQEVNGGGDPVASA